MITNLLLAVAACLMVLAAGEIDAHRTRAARARTNQQPKEQP